MKKICTAIFGLLLTLNAFGQQDPMFTKYMFSTLTFNPAYAGAEGHLSLGILHRTQWAGFGDGAPVTQTLNAHTPMKNERVGLGMNITNDNIGATNTLGGNIAYAYRIPMGKYKLAIGLQAGAEYYNFDHTKLSLKDASDYALDASYSKLLPNFGAGIYFSKEKKFYFGVGVPKLIEWNLRTKQNQNDNFLARQVRHIFFHTGAAFPINGDALVFKPSVMVRTSGLTSNLNKNTLYKNVSAPMSYDVDLSLFFYQQLWIGAAYRGAIKQPEGDNLTPNSSVNAWAAYYMKNGLRIGGGYDFSLTKLSATNSGSFELFLGYDFDYRVKKVVTPRYF
jgi:type IX secretion system PorP/SprF family membrane protein